MHAGAAAYVLKQSPSAVLLRAIREAASGGQYLDPALPLRPERPRRAGAPRTTERENQVLRMLAQGYSNKEIAAALAISVKTVEVHKANVMRKLSLRGRTDIVRYALLNGWLSES
jgi:DNA-binding NarL/FixJ family response regulator